MSLLTIAAAHRALAARQVSATELVEQSLARIERLDGTLHAFIRVTPERALADARASDARWSSGAPLGPLDGIPIAHKDIYETGGIATTAHSKLLQDNVPEADGTVVRRWREAGVSLLGKLATHEFAFGGPSFDLPWPPVRNPWNPEHFTAGSSSGTAAAIASGMIMGGTGSDTGGSIRGPSALVRPGRHQADLRAVQPRRACCRWLIASTTPGRWPGRSRMLRCCCRRWPGRTRPTRPAAPGPVPDLVGGLGRGVKGMRIGVARSWIDGEPKVSPATLAAVAGAEQSFREQGAEVFDVELPSLADFGACGFVILIVEAYAAHEPWMRTRFNDYGELLRDRMALGALVSGPDYVQALRLRRELCAEMATVMQGCDLLLTAAANGEAPRIDQVPKWAAFERPSLTIPFNVTGQPALTVCAGFGEGGLPVAIQLVGRPFDDAAVLAAGHAYERAHGWRAIRPALAT